MKRLGVDVGGTFTDLIYVDDEAGQDPRPQAADDAGRSLAGNRAGHPRDRRRRPGRQPSELDQVFHGTTIATNIVIEHNGARVGMITTEGYRDILHIARHKKPLNFSNYQDLPWQRYPIVRRRYRLTVPERITKDGSVLVPLDEEQAREQVRALKEAGVEAVAVCFLFSFLNPEHEARVAEIVREEFPEAFLSVSSEVLPQYREYERFSTVCLNAYVGPKVASYVRRLAEELRAAGRADALPPDDLGERRRDGRRPRSRGRSTCSCPARSRASSGGIWAGRQAGYDNVITLDVGGTSADIGLAQDGRLRMKHLLDTKVGPYQAMIPMVDVDTIGAGGGSIAYVDAGGIFRVGPRSAGADPGPPPTVAAARRPTATDAMVNLGWLVARGLPRRRHGAARRPRPHGVRGRPGDARSACRSRRRRWAPCRSSPTRWCSRSRRTRCARASTRATSRSSPRAAPARCSPRRSRSRSGRRGCSCRRYPGITAAMGLLATDMVYEYVSTAYQRLSKLDAPALQRALRGARGAGARRSSRRTASPPTGSSLQRVADCRYLGQGYELRVDAPSGAIDDDWVEKVRADFHDIHEREYSRRFEESDIEIPNVRVRGIGLMPPLADCRGRARRRSRPSRRSARGRGVVPGRRRAEQVATRYYDRERSWRATGSRAPRSSTSTTRRPSSRRGSRRTSTASGTSSSRSARPRRREALAAGHGGDG